MSQTTITAAQWRAMHGLQPPAGNGGAVATARGRARLPRPGRTYATDTIGSLELHEVKGHWEDDARVKIKVAARMHPWFRFRAVKAARGGRWEYEDFGRAGR